MKIFAKAFGLCVIPIGLILTSNATGSTINDNYIGGMYYNNLTYSYPNDIIGNVQHFAVEKMEVSVGPSTTKIDVYTAFVNYVTLNDNIDFGDLFLSNNGWTPQTPTSKDNFFNGEFWEFALVLDEHSGSTTSGIASLYAITNKDQYILSENTPAGGGSNRMGQEVQFDTGGKTAISTGTWSLFTDGISFTIDTSSLSLGAEDLGLRWTMTCANDIIEGSVPSNPVPEPATMLLFGTGVVALVGIGRKRKK